MYVYLPVRGESGEGADPIETPAIAYTNVQTAKAVCRWEEQKSGFGITDYTEVWKLKIQET